MAKPRPITLWNLAALLLIVMGGGAVLLLDHKLLRAWASSGTAFPIGERFTLTLPQGKTRVYYQSTGVVPTAATLHMWCPAGERSQPAGISDENGFRLIHNGESGRAFWELDVPQPGDYSFLCFNLEHIAGGHSPEGDRVVFLKSPDSLDDVRAQQTWLRAGGGGLMLAAAALCYLLHGRTLRRQAPP